MGNLRNVVYLEETQLEELRTNGTVTVNGTTIEYSDSDLYITPLDDFDGIYAKEEDLAAVESDVLDHEERVAELENVVLSDGASLVVQGKVLSDGGGFTIPIPQNIRQILSNPWAAKITVMWFEQENTVLTGEILGRIDDSGEYKLILDAQHFDYTISTNGYVFEQQDGEMQIPDGTYYFYKVEFIC